MILIVLDLILIFKDEQFTHRETAFNFRKIHLLKITTDIKPNNNTDKKDNFAKKHLHLTKMRYEDST